ncbi:MAG: hypothetical protein ACR2K2_00820 [Mycobacteriales bacterium]
MTDVGPVVAARSLANVLLLLLEGVIAARLPRHLVPSGPPHVVAARYREHDRIVRGDGG